MSYTNSTMSSMSRKTYTNSEQKVAQILSKHKVNYLTQYPIETHQEDDDGNEIVYHPDFLLPDWKIALEVDGKPHSKSAKQRKRDEQRDETLRSLGYQVVRIANKDASRVMEFLPFKKGEMP